MSQLEEIEAIKQLKYRYFRCLDSKLWDELADCFTEDAVTSYDSGKYGFEGREAIMKFLREGLGDPKIVSMHHGHHPEIVLTAADTARGTWYLEDYVIFAEGGTELHGAGFYNDEYVKTDGRWRLRSTGYVRTYEEIRDRAAVQQLRTMFEPDA